MPEECGPRNVIPGGWSYPEGDKRITSTGFNELVDALTKDRTQNGRPIGDPIGDIRAYVLREFPQYAGSVSVARPPVDEDALANNLRERVTVWSSNRYALRTSGHTELVSQEEANRRAEICQVCPKNQDYPHDCPSCVTALERTLFLLRQGKTSNPPLKACEITGQDNNTAVFLPDSMLQHRKKFQTQLEDEVPQCWLLSL